MRKLVGTRVIGFILILLPFFIGAQPSPEGGLMTFLESQKTRFSDVAMQIWDWAEVGYQEEKSAALLRSELEKEGFRIQKGVAGIPTAFIAEAGSGEPVIAILGEYDALPGVAQEAVPFQKPIEGQIAGHACGHHLFGAGSALASIAVKNWLENSGNSGTIRFYGTPAEEGGAGKVYLVREGLFDDVDAVLHWHPGNQNSADARSSLANKSAKFRFYGNASHASSAPWFGRSALDGVEAMNHMVNMMREHIPQESRIHYVITSGGEAPNVVPAYAEVYYYVRHPLMSQVKENFEWVVKAAEGAAIGTGTRMEYEVIHGIFNVLPNESLANVMFKNLNLVGGVEYSEKETAFAEEIKTTLANPYANLENARVVQPFKVVERGTGGSTDVGDISWVAPTAGLSAATWVPGTPAHSWQAVASGGTSIGTKGMMVAAKTLAMTAVELMQSSEILEKANEELLRRRGVDFKYESLLGDREPPLDYRK
jgi:aminobenzoyl-glutamate utilization protein B